MSQLVAEEKRSLPSYFHLSPKLLKYIRRAILYILVIVIVFWSIFPLFWVFISSIKPDTETYAFEQTILPQRSNH